MPVSSPAASDRRAGPLVPEIYRQRHWLTTALVLLGMALYFHYGHLLPVPGRFGEVDKRSGQTLYNEWLWLSAIVIGFFLVFGIAGRFAFSTASFVGLGAYVSHYATSSGNNWTVGLIAAMVTGFVVASVFAVLVRKAHHFYFAVATLGLAELLLLVFRRTERFTGRPGGEITGVRDATLFGFEFDSRYRHFWLLLVFLAIALAIAVLVMRSPLRRDAIAARDKPEVAETLGIDPAWIGIVMFTVGSVIAAAAGSIFVHTRQLGTPETFGLELGIGIFIVLILGGMHSPFGPIIGAWVYVYAPLYLERWEEWTQAIWGLVLVGVMIAFPDGLIGVFERIRDAVRGRVGPRRDHAGAKMAERITR